MLSDYHTKRVGKHTYFWLRIVKGIYNFERMYGRVISKLTEVGRGSGNCISMAQIKDHWGAVVETY
jgi:hypothetical protein